MTESPIDLDKLRVALRRMTRGNLLMIADRAIEIVPRAKLRALVGDIVRIDLHDEVQRFHDASIRREHYDSFNVNSKNYMDKSKGTEAFIAEFDRLLGKCIRAAAKAPRAPVRAAFELLLALLRRIDGDSDSIVFFADEGGSWQVVGDWNAALTAYFQCLADGASGDEFAREVDQVIEDFADYERPKHMAAARRGANAEQKAALRRLPARRARP